MRLAFSSDGVRPLSSLRVGSRGVIVDASASTILAALGVTPGATVTMLQRFPGFVFTCDQTELAVERAVADGVLVRVQEKDR